MLMFVAFWGSEQYVLYIILDVSNIYVTETDYIAAKS